MATNNLLVNNEYKVLRESRNKVERSPHNLSQSRKFPVEVGKIYPIFCRKTLPSDSIKIDVNILIKQLQPLLVPQMVSFSVQTAFYWVDYSLAWPDFEYFLINQRGDQTLELPYFQDIDINGASTSSHLGSVLQSSSNPNYNSMFDLLNNIRPFLDITANHCDDKIDALPFWAYQRVIRDYYTNIDRLSSQEYDKLFPKDPRKAQLKSGSNYFFSANDNYHFTGALGQNVNLDNCVPLSQIGVHNVRGDYFVNSYPTPIRGETPTLTNNLTINQFNAEIEHQNNIIQNTFDKVLEVSYNNIGDNAYNVSISSALHPPLNTDRSVLSAEGQNLESPSSSNPIGFFGLTSQNFLNLYNLITNPITFKNINGLSFDLSITTRQLRLLDAITRKREIDILMKPRLKNYLNTYFGVDNYKHDSLYQPIFIGSTTQQILINDIEQTTTTDSSPLGRQGATAISLADNYVGEYYCRNYGCLLGVMFILPDYDYEPAIPHEWSERTPDDFYNPEFAHLSMQAILNKELFVSDDEIWNNQVLGYGGVYDYYRTSNNYVSSLFLSPEGVNDDLKQFAQVRRFNDKNKPEITTKFLDSHKAFDMSVFAVPTMPPFMCQAVTRVRAVRPLPELATPDSSK